MLMALLTQPSSIPVFEDFLPEEVLYKIKSFKHDLEMLDTHRGNMRHVLDGIILDPIIQRVLRPIHTILEDPYYEFESDWDSDGHHYSGSKYKRREMHALFYTNREYLCEVYNTYRPYSAAPGLPSVLNDQSFQRNDFDNALQTVPTSNLYGEFPHYLQNVSNICPIIYEFLCYASP